MVVFCASVWFQLLWFLCVMGQTEWQWWALGGAVGTWLLHIVWGKWCWHLVIFSGLGIGLDGLNIHFDLFRFAADGFPIWLMSVWIAFAWYCHFLVPVLSRWPKLLMAMVGGLGGVTSYYAGLELGAVTFTYSLTVTLAILFLQWSVVTLCLVFVEERYKWCTQRL
ncbi:MULTISPECIES: DUF2878 domain-containing protein [Vibrio]|uniref:DUF2878 family protein n=1 Tax=Vibrio eleionomae TaxID=2653505 RepID=A0A7X4LNC7_9VIBR|nr:MULTISPECIES: DUF2878 domain-containing protein [Vibrio]MZI95099.1 DUF2878 family protein [Vibrio eleionomae]